MIMGRKLAGIICILMYNMVNLLYMDSIARGITTTEFIELCGKRASFLKGSNSTDHAHKGAGMAEKIMKSLNAFAEEEIKTVCTAIYNHSDKELLHTSFDEVLKDADVMQHCLYNPLFPVKEQEKMRYEMLRQEFGI